ncbi:MAG: glycosyltransferase family 4 protein [Rhodospirillaceae bacterium]|jgi:glycosyltransferase involved in cell wall biosynthesis|nr:glycosyltransferase family 4 protein [Rhodospirillaceae bacterium]
MKPPVRVMVVSRLFAGFADGLAERAWQPKGVPAAYKLFEALGKNENVDLLTVFVAKEPAECRFSRFLSFDLSPLGRVVILPWVQSPWLARLKLDGKLREMGHLLRCLWLYLKFRPDVAYFTNATFPTAAVFARLGLCKVVLRLLGLHPDQVKISERPGGIQKWLYHSPFDRVICTLDGSGPEHHLNGLIAPAVPRSIWLNGVDFRAPDEEAQAIIEEKYPLSGPPIVLFVGRLEWNKGCREFIEAIFKVLDKNPLALRAVLVGGGGLKDELAEKIKAASAQDKVYLAGAVPYSDISAWLARADIYVSLNMFGNLSNANLEALAAGKCMIILGSDPAMHTDEETDRLIPAEAVLRIGRDSPVENLALALMSLSDDRERIKAQAGRAKKFSSRFLKSWDERISQEVELILGL